MNENDPPPAVPRNRDTASAWDYHRRTNHSLESVRRETHRLDWSNQPRPYKLYANLPTLPLPEPADSTMPALAAISSAGATRDGVQVPDLQTLATVLQYSNGITKRLRFSGGIMDFRAAACTGALYHIELYVICGDLPGLEAGVYHFGAQDRALRRLRGGDYRGALVAATAREPAVAAAPAVLVCTSTFWRNAWKYQSRAYRHCFWDGGTLLANVLAVAAAHDLPAEIVTGFVDEDVNRLLDLDPNREVALALVPLGADPARQALDPGPVERLGLETVPPSPHEDDYPPIREMHAASSLASAEEAAAWRAGAPRVELPPGEGPVSPLLPPAPSVWPPEPIEAVIRRRGSSRHFSPEPIRAEALATLLGAATGGVPADDRPSLVAALSEPYLIVNRVEGLASGAYLYRRDQRALELLKRGDFAEEAGYLDLGQDLAAEAAVNVYFLSDLNAILPALGNRGYRAAQLDAAITAGRLYLGAYALRLGATGLTFFDDDVIAFFSPHARGKSVMFLLALGRPARRAR